MHTNEVTTPMFLVDAFVSDTFRGNPAGVCLPEKTMPDAWMQAVAQEMNQAETAFVQPRDDGDWDLRWFTPTREIELCGHATMASAHVLLTTGRANGPVRFHTLSGVLSVESSYEMDFPARPCQESVNPAEMAQVLGVDVVAAAASEGVFLVELESEAAIRAHIPDFAKIQELRRIGVIITAPGSASDFVSRFYAPNFGVPEDPATGSAHCALAPYWAAKLGRERMVGHQLSARGGEIGVRVAGDRVVLIGQARTFLEGTLA